MKLSPVVGSTIAAAVGGFLSRPCCIVPAAMSLAGVGSARLTSVVPGYYLELRLMSGVLLIASIVVNSRRDGGWFNKLLSVAASLTAFVSAAGWLGGS